MLVHDVTHVALDSFRQRSAGKKIVLIYPWTNYRNLFLTYFLSSAREGLLYYRINDDQVSLNAWVGGMMEEFQSVLNNFGNNLQQALQEGKPAQIGEALAADLGHYSSEPLILFIDELDRVAIDSDFNQFIRALVDAADAGIDHDVEPVSFIGAVTGAAIDLGAFSRRRERASTSGTVMG